MQAKTKTTEVVSKKTKWKGEQKLALVVALIPLIGFVIFNGFPLLISFIGMFCNVDLYDLGNIQWNNFEGFKSVFIPRHAFNLFYFDCCVKNLQEADFSRYYSSFLISVLLLQ